jgi:membrane protease YdiL (CAAX protease family)
MELDEVPIAASPPKPFALWPFVSVTLQAFAATVLATILLYVAYAIGCGINPDWPRIDTLHAGSLVQETLILLSYAVLLLTTVPRLPRLAHRSLGEMLHGFQGRDWRVFGIFFALQLALRFANAGVLALFHQSAHVQSGFKGIAFASPFAFVIFALGSSVAAPFAEEFFFRGLIFAGLAARMPWVTAACISGLLFGLTHGDLILLPSLSILGFLNAAAYQRTGNLAVSIALHASYNSISLVFIALKELK